MNNNDDDNIRRTSLRIDESLAVKVDRLAENDGRSFNNQILELIKKGITLANAEKKILNNANPINLLKVAASCDEDDSPKNRDTPDKELETGKRGKGREFA